MHDQAISDRATSRGALWFGFLGGAVAWTIHILVASVAAEWGCITHLGNRYFLGITAMAWLLIAVSVLALALAGLAFFVSYRSERQLRTETPEERKHLASGYYMARAGLLHNVLFIFVILVQSVPIFFFLRDC